MPKRSAYSSAVEHSLRGLEAVSTGTCPGCDECREAFPDYCPAEDWGHDETETWRFEARPDAAFRSEEAAIAAAREAFEQDWRDGKLDASEPSFAWSECGICGSRLGGNREVWHYVHGGKLYHADDACTDCVLYLATGDAPEDWDG